MVGEIILFKQLPCGWVSYSTSNWTCIQLHYMKRTHRCKQLYPVRCDVRCCIETQLKWNSPFCNTWHIIPSLKSISTHSTVCRKNLDTYSNTKHDEDWHSISLRSVKSEYPKAHINVYSTDSRPISECMVIGLHLKYLLKIPFMPWRRPMWPQNIGPCVFKQMSCYAMLY